MEEKTKKMESGEEKMKEKKRFVVESLGWLTESTIMPKKHKAIEGVGASSILELKAQLYKTQEEAKKSKDLNPDANFHRAKSKIVRPDVLSQKNSGVDARAHKDKLELKAVKDGSVSYAALEKKAQLYDKLVRGEIPDEEEKEKYCVDFFNKGLAQDDDDDDDDDDEEMFGATVGHGRRMAGGVLDNDEHKRFVREVHEEVNEARDKVTKLKLQRQEVVNARREKLRQAYLRKHLQKLKAAHATAIADKKPPQL